MIEIIQHNFSVPAGNPKLQRVLNPSHRLNAKIIARANGILHKIQTRGGEGID